MPSSLQLALLGVVLTAGTYDWRFRKIPNWVSLCGLILGLGLHVLLFGVNGLTTAFLGTGLALLVYLPLYCLRGMGAGDVKLMAAIGALAGPGNWLDIFLLTALAGGLLSLLVVLYKRRVVQTLLNINILTSELLQFRRPAHAGPELDVRDPSALRMPHALPIAVGSLLFLATAR